MTYTDFFDYTKFIRKKRFVARTHPELKKHSKKQSISTLNPYGGGSGGPCGEFGDG